MKNGQKFDISKGPGDMLNKLMFFTSRQDLTQKENMFGPMLRPRGKETLPMVVGFCQQKLQEALLSIQKKKQEAAAARRAAPRRD
mgnify:CR=1 FL=1